MAENSAFSNEKAIYAKLANAAYDAYKNPSSVPTMKIGSYQAIPQLSDKDAILFVSRQNRELVLAIRGTVPTNPEDLALDATIVKNKLTHTPRFAKLLQKCADIIED